MARYWLASNAMCPYYRDENATMVRCAGWVPDAVHHLAFANRGSAQSYKTEFCKGNYEHCAIYAALSGCDRSKETGEG